MAQSIANDSDMQDWATTLFSIPSDGTGPAPATRLKTVNEQLTKELLKILLEVYMDDEFPPQYDDLSCTSSKGMIHGQLEGNIIENMNAGQNFEVKERTWEALREAEPIIIEDDYRGEVRDHNYLTRNKHLPRKLRTPFKK